MVQLDTVREFDHDYARRHAPIKRPDSSSAPATLPQHHTVIGRLLEREESLSPHATKSIESQGRREQEQPSPVRTEFQRDRDRILHTNAFRRLKHKTQVFIAPQGDHYATRLTHTLEVSQIARTIARALNLNEDLTEAISLGHDMGHTPFGHIGEDELSKLHPAGYRHNEQSLRLVEQIENEGQGLNLTWEVRQGILMHSKPQGDFLDRSLVEGLTLESQIVRISDAVAYLNHDLGDAFRAGVLSEDSVPDDVIDVLGSSHPQRVDTMVVDIIESSWAATGLSANDGAQLTITMSDRCRSALNTLRDFMFRHMYEQQDKGPHGQTARQVMRLLYGHFNENRSEIPSEYSARSKSEDAAAVDFISGMTDHYALGVAEGLQPGVAAPFDSRWTGI